MHPAPGGRLVVGAAAGGGPASVPDLGNRDRSAAGRGAYKRLTSRTHPIMVVNTRHTRWRQGALFGAALAAALAFLVLDAIWLTTMGQRLYRPAIGHLMREDFNLAAAAAFYAIYLTGVVVFVVAPATSTRSALTRGALFGLVAYATYDLTNQATLRGWPWHVTLIDLCWGSFVTAASSAFAYRVAATRRG